jgi:hypothetical protein
MREKSQELLWIKLAVHSEAYMNRGKNTVQDMEITREEVVLLLAF